MSVIVWSDSSIVTEEMIMYVYVIMCDKSCALSKRTSVHLFLMTLHFDLRSTGVLTAVEVKQLSFRVRHVEAMRVTDTGHRFLLSLQHIDSLS